MGLQGLYGIARLPKPTAVPPERDRDDHPARPSLNAHGGLRVGDPLLGLGLEAALQPNPPHPGLLPVSDRQHATTACAAPARGDAGLALRLREC
jgi:hypothetical protein